MAASGSEVNNRGLDGCNRVGQDDRWQGLGSGTRLNAIRVDVTGTPEQIAREIQLGLGL
jgi:hypothetical protein